MVYIDVVDVVAHTPLDEVIPHLRGLLEVELTGTQKPQQVSIVEYASIQALFGDLIPELFQHGKLVGRTITRPSTLSHGVTLCSLSPSLTPYAVF